MSGSFNLGSQQISFVNKISLIHKATSDNENPTPSYLFKEINDISFESIGYCESLVEFLLDRLKSKSCHVKLKVLKVMKHVSEHGSKEFQLGIRASADLIKEYTKFSGPPHPLHGNVPYVMVRNIAKELCEILYNLDPFNMKRPSINDHVSHRTDPKYGGLGPSRSGGAIQGFGNLSTSQHKGLGETILEGIEKLGNKISETPADRQTAMLAKLNLSGSSSNYQPPVITPSRESSPLSQIRSPESPNSRPIIRKPVSRHLPGKAGGGWNDEDDDESESPEGTNDNYSDQIGSKSIETDSLVDNSNQGEVQADWCEETALVDTYMSKYTVHPDKQALFIPYSAISDFIIKCSSVNCDNVVRLLSQKLSCRNPILIARSLQAIEGFIYNEEELINIDLVATICKSPLVDCFHYCDSQKVSVADDIEVNGEKRNIQKQLQMKSAKIILLLQQLSSHKDMLGQDEIIGIFQTQRTKQNHDQTCKEENGED